MIAIRPYSEYKTSSIDWLEDVPSHWRTASAKSMIQSSTAGFWGDDATEHNKCDHIRCIRVADFNVETLSVSDRKATKRAIPKTARLPRLLEPGDILLEKSGGGENQPVGRVVAFDSPIPAVTSNFVTRLRVNADVANPRFILRTLDLMQRLRLTLASIKQTTGIQNLDEQSYLSNPIPLPPLPEQRTIADFLDVADARINRYIVAKRRMIALLEEQKQAIINQAVTRGLDPDVPLKPSGVEWLGDIPAHWGMLPNKLFLQLHHDIVGSSSTNRTLLSLTKKGIIPRDLENPQGKFPASFDSYQEVKRGDLVFCLFDIDETPRCVGISDVDGMITGAYTVLRCADSDLADYIYLFFLAMDQQKLLNPLYTGLRKTISKDVFLAFKIPLPPLEERRQIVSIVSASESGTLRTSERLQREIELIQEYRTRLISDVVTGKLDVRGVELPALEEVVDAHLDTVGSDLLPDDELREIDPNV